MRRVAAIAVLSCLPLSAVMADVYRSVDAQGHVLYSDTPSPGAELLRTTGNGPQRTFTASAATPVQRSAPASAQSRPGQPKNDEQIKDQLAHEAAARSVASDMTQSRVEQCKKAQDTYQKSIDARRIYNEDKNGERTYLSDADADAARVNNKIAMDEVCKN